MVNENSNMVAVTTEANHVDTDNGWWLDTMATIHIVAKDLKNFKKYEWRTSQDGH